MNEKKRVLFALKARGLEEELERTLSKDFIFVGGASYKEVVLDKIKSTNPDILVLREALPGTEPILNLLFQIRAEYPNVRIVFMTGKRRAGDLVLGEIVSYGVYDLVLSEKVTKSEIVNLMLNPTPWDSVKHLLPRRNFDEDSTEPAFKVNTQIINAGGALQPNRPQTESSVELPQKPLPAGESGNAQEPQRLSTPVVKAQIQATEEVQAEQYKENKGLFGRNKNNKEKKNHKNEKFKGAAPDMIGSSEEQIQQDATEVPFEGPKVQIKTTKQATKHQPQFESQPKIQSKEVSRPQIQPPVEQSGEGFIEEKVVRTPPVKKVSPTVPQRKNNPAPVITPQRKGSTNPSLGLPKKKPAEKVKKAKTSPFGTKAVTETAMKSRKIVSFVGAQGGVGTTQLAFNAAVELADGGARVVFVELNREFSTVDFSLQLGTYHQGIDVAIKEDNVATSLSNNIQRMTDVVNREGSVAELLKIYRKLPQTLDFMMYSQDHQTLLEKPEVDESKIKDLITNLFLQEGYDYVVVDAGAFGSNDSLIYDVISIATETYLVMTQDFAQIGLVSRHLIELEKRINVSQKVYYVLNKYERGVLDVSSCSELLQSNIAFVFPYAGGEFNEANYLGVPFVLNSRNAEALQTFKALKQKISE